MPRFKLIDRGFAFRDICYESDYNFSLNNFGHNDNWLHGMEQYIIAKSTITEFANV